MDNRSRVEVARWMAEPTPWSRRSQAEEAIAGWNDLLAQHDGRLGTWAVVPAGEDRSVGAVSPKPLPEGHGEVADPWYGGESHTFCADAR